MATLINEQIKILVELQKIDGEIWRLRRELDAQPERERKLAADFERKKVALKSSEGALKSHQMRQKDKEGELGTKEEKIKKLQIQLYTLKSNKEYQTMDLEIKGLKADKSLLEEDILRQLDVVEEARAGVSKEKERLAADERQLEAEQEALKKKAAEIQSALAALEERRKGYTPNVEAKILGQYDRLLKKREGLALVPVKNDSCGGCHLELPPQAVNEIQMQERVIVCESCARILYYPG